MSAAIVREDAAAAWGASVGEAIHTSTFLGNPLACAAALASLDVLARTATATAIDHCAAALEAALRARLAPTALGVRRLTFVKILVGVTLDGGLARALGVCRRLLERGFIVLTGGVEGDVLTLTPPASLSDVQIDAFVTALAEVLVEVPRS